MCFEIIYIKRYHVFKYGILYIKRYNMSLSMKYYMLRDIVFWSMKYHILRYNVFLNIKYLYINRYCALKNKDFVRKLQGAKSIIRKMIYIFFFAEL